MKTGLTPKQIERGRAFLVDLRANEKKAVGQMRDDNGGRCCLCVALDTGIRLGCEVDYSQWNEDSDGVPPSVIADLIEKKLVA